MERLTTDKDVSEMGMLELAHNSCYIKDGVARYRDFENDYDARDLAMKLAWSLADVELTRDIIDFDKEMMECLQYDPLQTPIGLIALFYRNMWAMADLRERLKVYEDAEEQGCVGTDDVCEWKTEYEGRFIKNPHTNRGFSNEESMKNIYCNTCGKKIKVVE